MVDEPQRVTELLVRRGVLDPAKARDCLREYAEHAGDISFLGMLLLAGLIGADDYEDLRASLVLDGDVDTAPTIDLAREETQPIAPLRPRAVLIGGNYAKYELVRELGRGGMGAVWLARDRDLERLVAVKLCHDPDPATLERFVREAQIGSQLDHPNIAPIYDAGMASERQAFFAMKFVQGTALARVLDRLARGESEARATYPQRRRLDVLTKALEGVAYAHAKLIVHRDLKPDNVMLGRHGEVLVVDWGLARALDPTRTADELVDSARPSARLAADGATLDGAIMGTPGYMSPEQARGEIARVDARSDVYAMGAILYEMLTLVRAYPHVDAFARLEACAEGTFLAPSAVSRDGPIPPALEAICLTAMAVDPADRYATAEAMLADVRAYLDDRPVSVHRASLVERARARTRRHAGAILATAIAMAVIAVVSGLAARESARRYAEEQSKLAAERDLGAAREERAHALVGKLDAIAAQQAVEERARRAADARARAFGPFLEARTAMAWTIDTRTLKGFVVGKLEEAVRIDPTFVEARLDLIAALGYLDRSPAIMAQALALYQHLAPDDRARLEPVFGPLALALAAGRPAELPPDVDALRPTIIPVTHWQALVALLLTGAKDERALAYLEPLATAPEAATRWELHVLFAKALLAVGRHEEARVRLDAQIVRLPQLAPLYVTRAMYLRLVPQPERAIADLVRALELDPDSHLAYRECAHNAMTSASLALERQPFHPANEVAHVRHLMAAFRHAISSIALDPSAKTDSVLRAAARSLVAHIGAPDAPRETNSIATERFAERVVDHVRGTRARAGAAAEDARFSAEERDVRAELVLFASSLAGLASPALGPIARALGVMDGGALPATGRAIHTRVPEAREWLAAAREGASLLDRPAIEAELAAR